MDPSNNETFNAFDSLQMKKRKKNDYVKLQEGAYPREFVGQVEKAISAVATGKLSETRMVRRDPRSGYYLLTMGFGKRNTHFGNNYIAQGEVAECGSALEAQQALDTILKAAKAGEFDDALNELCNSRQEHAIKMIEARDVCGFHRHRKPKGQGRLVAPTHLTDASEVVSQHQ